MSNTLRESVDADETLLLVDGDAGVPGQRYLVDDELVQLRGFGNTPRDATSHYSVDPTQWLVTRATDDTTAASHSGGTELVLYGSPFAAAGGGGGGVTGGATLLGPFRVSFDDVGIQETGGGPVAFADGGYVEVADLPDGCVVLQTYVEVVTNFNGSGGNGQTINVDVQPAGDVNRSTDLSIWKARRDTSTPDAYTSTQAMSPISLQIVNVVTGCRLSAYYTPGAGGSTPTAGEADVYALILAA